MPLGNVAPFHDWCAVANPPEAIRAIVWDWIKRLDTVPWQFPSEPLTDLSDEVIQVRRAIVPGTGTTVWYSEVYAQVGPGQVDLMLVR